MKNKANDISTGVDPGFGRDPYPKIADPDHKPNMTVYCRVVFSDTGTVKDLTPTHMKPNDEYQINYTRSLENVDCEPRAGIKYVGYVKPE